MSRRLLLALAAVALTVPGCTRGQGEATPTTGSGSATTSAQASSSDSPSPQTAAADLTSGSASGSAEQGTPTAGSVPLPTEFRTVERSIRDPQLGHEIVVTKIARAMAWPPGYRGQELAFELVGVEMRWTTGAAYTAPIRAVDFAIATTSAFPNRADRLLEPTLVAAGWTVLPETLPAGQSITGWMVFKVDPKGAATLRLDYTRPAMRVTNSPGTTFGKQVLSIDLTAPPEPATATPTAPTAPTPVRTTAPR